MREVRDGLYVAGDDACRSGGAEMAVVHACKRPCHRQAVGYTGTLPRDHPGRHARRDGNDLFLNLVDRQRPRYDRAVFEAFFAFSAAQWGGGRELLVHCNAGRSRSPVLAMLFLAGVTQDISAETYEGAVADYAARDPDARPGAGLRTFARTRWEALMEAARQARTRS
jgi:hypothetical protein